jgi:drug/metabolite transporter (DMT)-like permease
VVQNISDRSPALHRKAIFMLLSATIFWASSFLFVKSLLLEQQKLLPDAGSWFCTFTGVMYRFGAAAVLLGIYLNRNLLKITRLELEQGLVLGVFGVGGILFQVDGLAYTSASTSAFLTQSYAVLIPLWLAFTQRRRPQPKIILCVALVMIGLAILADLDIKTLRLGRGEAETLISSVLFAGQILWLGHPRYFGNDPLRFSVVMFATMAAACIPGIVATAPNFAACIQAYASPAAILFVGGLVIICTLGGYLFMNRWQPHVTATEAGLIYSIEPVLTSVLALFFPALISIWANIQYDNEPLSSRLLIGGALVTAANVLLQKKTSTTDRHG